MDKFVRWSVIVLGVSFFLINIIAYNHAYQFTHFSNRKDEKTVTNSLNSFSDKIILLLTGVDNPRPINKRMPKEKYETLYLKGKQTLEAWLITTNTKEKGIVLLFHGYTGEKSDLLGVAEKFRQLGYHTILVDFPGSGGSDGMATTIGYEEAEDVKKAFLYAKDRFNNLPIILYGFSLGGTAIMRAVSKYNIEPSGAIVEAPFGTMLNSVCNRFEMLNIPSFPFAHLLTFWGGIQHGFWAFSHNPIDYAKGANIPILLTLGLLDDRVDIWEVEKIYTNIRGYKELHFFDEAEHELASEKYPNDWLRIVDNFLYEIQNN